TKALGLGIAFVVGLLTLDVAGPSAFGAKGGCDSRCQAAKAASRGRATTASQHATTTRTSTVGNVQPHVGGTARTTFARPSRVTNTQQVHQDERQFNRDTKQVKHLESS